MRVETVIFEEKKGKEMYGIASTPPYGDNGSDLRQDYESWLRMKGGWEKVGESGRKCVRYERAKVGLVWARINL